MILALLLGWNSKKPKIQLTSKNNYYTSRCDSRSVIYTLMNTNEKILIVPENRVIYFASSFPVL